MKCKTRFVFAPTSHVHTRVFKISPLRDFLRQYECFKPELKQVVNLSVVLRLPKLGVLSNSVYLRSWFCRLLKRLCVKKLVRCQF